MELVRWNPMREMVDFHNRFNSFFGNFWTPTATRTDSEGAWNWNPAVDVYEKDETIVVKAELPGVDKKDITVDINGDNLVLKGERTTDHEVKEKRYYRREMSCGSFERHFRLPENVDPEKIKADFKDGVLTIEIAKPEESKPKQITVH